MTCFRSAYTVDEKAVSESWLLSLFLRLLRTKSRPCSRSCLRWSRIFGGRGSPRRSGLWSRDRRCGVGCGWMCDRVVIRSCTSHLLRLNRLKIELQFCPEAKLFGNTIFISIGGKFEKNKKPINTWRWMACSSTILYTAVMNVC